MLTRKELLNVARDCEQRAKMTLKPMCRKDRLGFPQWESEADLKRRQKRHREHNLKLMRLAREAACEAEG